MKIHFSLKLCCALTLLVGFVLLPVPAIGGDRQHLVVDDDKVQCPNAAFSNIQDAVDAATPGAVIRVCPGNYAEQVAIHKPLTIAADSGAVLMPGTMKQNTTSLFDGAPLATAILVTDTTDVTIEGLIVDGANNGVGQCSPRIFGIAFQNASGEISRVAIRNFRLGTGLGGCQSGTGIFVQSGGGGISNVEIEKSTIHDFQKNGITADEVGTQVSVHGNVVTGIGPTAGAAQNGIQIGFGASGHVMRNTVTGNSYTGMNNASSAGILVFGGCGGELTTGVQIVANIVGDATPADGNDIGVALANYDPTCVTAPSAATNNKVINNVLTDDETTNVSGNGYPSGYQAGISDSGVNDKLINNDISGQGYATYPCPSTTATEHCAIDTDSSSAAKVHANSLNP